MRFSKITSCFIIIILISVSNHAEGQDTLVFNSIIFKVAPLAFVNFYSLPTAQAGFEFRFTPRTAIDFSYGQIIGKGSYGETGHGFKSKFEVRRYLRPKHEHRLIKSYVAIEGYYNQEDYSSRGEFTIEDSVGTIDQIFYIEEYRIKKKVGGLNLKYGFTISILKRFVLNVYGGVGVRVKETIHFDRSRPKDIYYDQDLARYNRDKEGNYVYPNLTIGLKIGYVLKKKTTTLKNSWERL